MKKNKVILIDCDDVLADFINAFFAEANKITGKNYHKNDLNEWDILSVIKEEEIKKELFNLILKKDFCLNIPTIHGAQEAIKELKKIGDVVVVTAPPSISHWVHERTQWLESHFDIPHNKIIHTTCKEYVSGDYFIDDKYENLIKWKKNNPNGKAILWDAPYNKKIDCELVTKLYSWEELINFIK